MRIDFDEMQKLIIESTCLKSYYNLNLHSLDEIIIEKILHVFLHNQLSK